MTYRHRAKVLAPVHSLTEAEHTEIKQLALESKLDWSTLDGKYAPLIAKFRSEAKEHYFKNQRRRCCYCSIELHDHKLTYDAEHILDKSTYPEYMFDAGNLAVACKLCNGHKSNQSISSKGLRFEALSSESGDYSIVHPHLDEWFDHLEFDSIGRIVSKTDSTKGRTTISVCGIQALNSVRLADNFDVDASKEAEIALRAFHEIESLSHKESVLAVIEELALRYDHPGSRAVVVALREDVRRQQSGPLVPDQSA